MPQPYADPSFTSLTDLFAYVNSVTQEWAVTMIPITLFIVVLIMTISLGRKKSDSFLTASIISLSFAILLWAAGLISPRIITIFFALTIMSGIYTVFDND